MSLTKEQKKEIAKYQSVLKFLWQQDPLFILNYRGDESIIEKLIGLVLDKEAVISKRLFMGKLVEGYIDVTKVYILLHDFRRSINRDVWSFTDEDYDHVSKSLVEIVTGMKLQGGSKDEENDQ